MDTLTSARRKVERGTEQLLPVLAKIRELRSGKPYAIALDYKPETRRQHFQISQLDPWDTVGLGLLVGDAVHNLRSALDHIMFGLAERNNGRPLLKRQHRDIYFPITTNYRELMTHSAIPYLTVEQIAIVERYQPFDGRDDKRLRTLNTLWNLDKHQIMQPVLVAVPQSGISFAPNEDAGAIIDRDIKRKITFDHQTYEQWIDLGWVEVEALGPEPQVHVNALTIEIPLGQSGIEAETLADIPDLVLAIVEEFAEFL